MKTFIKSLQSEDASKPERAIISMEGNEFIVEHYDFQGRIIMTSVTPDQRTAELAASDWLSGYQNLKG